MEPEQMELPAVRISENLTKDAANIKAHIRLVLEGLRELQELPNE